MDMQAIWNYFTSMAANDVMAMNNHKYLVISGCLQVDIYHLLFYLLRSPVTSLILATRDFADRAYSVYNYWCSRSIDDDCSPGLHGYTSAGKQSRSPLQFHHMIKALNGTTPSTRNKVRAHHMIRADWETRSSYFRDKVRLYSSPPLGGGGGGGDSSAPNPIFMVAMEALSQNPKLFWQRVIRFLHLKPSRHHYFRHVKEKFEKRVNEGSVTSKASSLMNETRALLNLVWHEDCLWTSRATGFRYPACHS